jgi:hypothetical protein
MRGASAEWRGRWKTEVAEPLFNAELAGARRVFKIFAYSTASALRSSLRSRLPLLRRVIPRLQPITRPRRHVLSVFASAFVFL